MRQVSDGNGSSCRGAGHDAAAWTALELAESWTTYPREAFAFNSLGIARGV